MQDRRSGDGCGDGIDGDDAGNANDGEGDDGNDDADNAIIAMTNFLPELTKRGPGEAALKASKTISEFNKRGGGISKCTNNTLNVKYKKL